MGRRGHRGRDVPAAAVVRGSEDRHALIAKSIALGRSEPAAYRRGAPVVDVFDQRTHRSWKHHYAANTPVPMLSNSLADDSRVTLDNLDGFRLRRKLDLLWMTAVADRHPPARDPYTLALLGTPQRIHDVNE